MPPPASDLQQLQAAEAAAATAGFTPSDQAVAACPNREWYALEVKVVGEDNKPAADVGIELSDGSRMLRDYTDSNGAARFEGLDPKSYQVCLYDLDQDAWEVIDTAPLPPPRSVTHFAASWAAAASKQTTPRDHNVEAGECISSIGFLYGFFPDTLWTHPLNTQLNNLRKDGNILFPGDIVHVPARRGKQVAVSTKQIYTVRRKGIPETLVIRFVDGQDQPRAGLPYLLKLNTRGGQTIRTRRSQTDGSGVLREPIPPDADTGELILGTGENQEKHQLSLGRVSPVDKIEGVRNRLNNLGYSCGDERGELGPRTRLALEGFQDHYGLEVTGEPDQATQQKLVEVHAS